MRTSQLPAAGNAIQPDLMTADERLAEIAKILSIGLVRLRTPKSSGLVGEGGECLVDFAPTQSLHAAPTENAGARP